MKASQKARFGNTLASVLITLTAPLAWAQQPAATVRPVLGYGEVTGNDVYVRSGPSLNHYPVCKISAGARITVVGENGEWFEIIPPEDTFSFVSGDYVDSPDGKAGVINGDNVRVRAGSALEDFAQQKYVVQTNMSKGSAVEIIGRDPDGFLRIKPPKGVTVWISRALVEMTPDSAVRGGPSATTASPSAAPLAEATGTTAATTVDVSDGPIADDNALTHVEATDVRSRLAELDRRTDAEVKKPVLERNLDELIAEYRTIADQQEDTVAREYAAARVTQVSDMAALVNTVQTMRRLNDDAAAQRRDYLERRAKIGEAIPAIPAGLDARGELRESALYPDGTWPKRYRLINIVGGNERTVGYVEVPRGANIDAAAFVGQYVGVRAATKRLLGGGVDAVPIFVVGEIVRLDRENEGPGQAG